MKCLTLRTDEPEKYKPLQKILSRENYILTFERLSLEGVTRSPLEEPDPTLITLLGTHLRGYPTIHRYLTRVLKLDLEVKVF